MCYNIGISLIMIYNIGISKKKNNYSFEDNQAHYVQCISPWSSFNFLFPITESLDMHFNGFIASSACIHKIMEHADDVNNFLTEIAWLLPVLQSNFATTLVGVWLLSI